MGGDGARPAWRDVCGSCRRTWGPLVLVCPPLSGFGKFLEEPAFENARDSRVFAICGKGGDAHTMLQGVSAVASFVP